MAWVTEWESGQNVILKSDVSGYESRLSHLLEVGAGGSQPWVIEQRQEGKDGK